MGKAIGRCHLTMIALISANNSLVMNFNKKVFFFCENKLWPLNFASGVTFISTEKERGRERERERERERDRKAL